MSFSLARCRNLLRRNRRLAVPPALLLLLALNADLAHSHEGDDHNSLENDLSIHFDCGICLKLGQNEELAVGGEFVLDLAPAGQSFSDSALKPRYPDSPAAKSRSPPTA